jgi:type III secretory pathway component EscU
MWSRIKMILWSWDILAALVAAAISYKFTPEVITNKFCVTIYGTAIGILSIIFSIFFASLAIIMSLPDNDFINFIENPERLFTSLLSYFKLTLMILFLSLLFTISLYVYSMYGSETDAGNRGVFVLFSGIFIYSLVATIIAVNITLSFTERRVKYQADKKPKP